MTTSSPHRRPLLGVVYLLALALFVGTSIAAYRKALPWQGRDSVSFETTQVGLGLKPLSDVKYQGVLVGEVRRVTTTGTVATVELALDREQIRSIPADVDAFVVPKTLFGDKFVDLRTATRPEVADRFLEDGATIRQSTRAVELGQIFDRLVPVLRALQPERLSIVLGSLAEALDGRGDDIARTLRTTDALLTELAPSYDDLVADLGLLADTADVYSRAAPDLLEVLDDAAGISRDNLVPHEDDLRALLDAATATAGSTRNVLADNADQLVRLAGRARPVLEVLDHYASEVPCVLEALDYGNRLANLATGVRGPYIALSIDMVVDQEAYEYPDDLPDDPSSDTNLGNLPAEVPGWDPHCPRIPERVRSLPTSPPPYSQTPYGQVFGDDAGTPAEPASSRRSRTPQEALARALAARSLGIDPADVPPYAELLLGPLTSSGTVEVP